MNEFAMLGIAVFGMVIGFGACYFYRERSELSRVTSELKNALAHTKKRGDWGERMVEDVLTPIGFLEGINYEKQYTGGGNTRPDYSFRLPKNLRVNLDSKFPLDNYLKLHETESKSDQDLYKKQFLSDVKKRIKEVTNKDYINPDDNTVDFVIVFIPNEQVYNFIHRTEPSLFDDALKQKVVLCSPWTLYPILSIIRMAIDNFVLELNAKKLLNLWRNFDKEWDNVTTKFERMEKQIVEITKEFEELSGVRQKKLNKVLEELNDLRHQSNFHDINESGVSANSTDPT